MAQHTERSTVAACVATVLGVPTSDVPLDDEERRAWLAERGLGLVPIADPAGFAWAGPWIAWRREAGGAHELRAVVMFGVPSGPIFDPVGTLDDVHAGAVIAPLDVSVWEPPSARDPGTGIVEDLVLARSATAATVSVAEAVGAPGRGLEGDRYADGAGTFASGRPGSALTLVDAAVLDELAAARGAPIDHRRNVVVRGTDLNALVGRRFELGGLICHGRRMCEPCAHLDRMNGGSVLRPLVHRGGLRADIVTGGVVRRGDRLIPL